MSTLLTTPRDDQRAPTRAQVDARVAELAALELRDRTSFAEELADNIVEPDPVDTAAFRSDELAFKSLAAAIYLLQRTEEQIARHRRDRNRKKEVDAGRFGVKVQYERRLLQNITDGIKARNGIVPTAPNLRRRAMDRLVNENLAGDVPRGRFRQILEEEKAKEAERKKQEKKARRQNRRDRDG